MSDNDQSTEELLGSLYPHLSQNPDGGDKSEQLQQSLTLKVEESIKAKQRFFTEQAELLIAVAEQIASCYRNGGRLLTAGNGGSSCDAAHLALEFMHPVTSGRPALPAFNLSQDSAMHTAVSNDLGFEHVLPRQLLALARAEDLLVLFTTSGNSKNLQSACDTAKKMGLSVVVFSGGEGGVLAQHPAVSHCLIVKSDSVHRIQESHLVAYHILWDLVHTLLADERGRLGEHGNR